MDQGMLLTNKELWSKSSCFITFLDKYLQNEKEACKSNLLKTTWMNQYTWI